MSLEGPREPPLGDRQEPRLGDRRQPPFADRQEPRLGDRQEPPFGDRQEPPLVDRRQPPLADRREPPLEDPRELTDPRAMRAITHPVRLALVEALGLEAPLTATRAAEVIGESPTTCSFHFRQLAKYGFVEEASTGPGRTRSWRLTVIGMHFSDVEGGAEARIAARALSRTLRERSLARLHAYYEARAGYPERWQEVTGHSEFTLYVTPEELRTVDEEITAILHRFRERIGCPELRPPDSLPVEVLRFAYPVRAPAP